MRRTEMGARDRFGGARIAAAALSAAGAAGATAVHLQVAPLPEEASALHLYAATMACAGWTGWRMLGLGLGAGWMRAALKGLSGAAIAVTIFCIAAAARETAEVLGRVRFATALDVGEHLLRRAIDHAEALGAVPVLVAIAAAGVAVGLAAEALHHLWRWDRDSAID